MILKPECAQWKTIRIHEMVRERSELSLQKNVRHQESKEVFKMRMILKFMLNLLSISAGPAIFLLLWSVCGLACLGWGIRVAPDAAFPEPFAVFRNLYCAAGILMLTLTYLFWLGFIYEPERRRLIFCVSLSLLLHGGLFLLMKEAIVGQEFEREEEVALNLRDLRSKTPIIVNDFYYGDLEGDEVFQENYSETEAENVEPQTMRPGLENSETPENTPLPVKPQDLDESLKRAEDVHKMLETEQKTAGSVNGEDARSRAEEIQTSEIEEVQHELEVSDGPQEMFVNMQKIAAEVAISGVIGSESPQLENLTAETKLHSAESVERRTVNLRKEAQKKSAKKTGFRKKLNENQQKTLAGKESRKGENVVSGRAGNWGESAVDEKAGGAGEELGELRSGLGEARELAAGAASLKTAKKKPRKKSDRTLTVSDAPANVRGGQTLGARAGDGDDLAAVLAGAVNGVSDAVLEATAKPEKIAGSNILDAEKEQILKNIVVFRFERSETPEMGFQPDMTETLPQDGEEDEWLAEITGEEENLDGPEVEAGSSVAEILQNDPGLRSQPTLPYRQRMRQDHRKLIEKAGGNPETEEIIQRGLQYLSRTQFEDGHWSLNFLPNGLPEGVDREEYGFGSIHADTAATGLALLTYLGAGYTHLESDDRNEYTETVNRALRWLIRNQQPDGGLFSMRSDAHRYGRIYSHGMAAIALCEAYGMTHDERLREPAQKAIDFLVKSQGPQGGWRYTPEKNDGVWRGESDTSVTGWQTMALVSAKMAGLNVPESCFRKVENWLETAAVNGGERYCYLPVKKPLNEEMEQWKKPSHAMTAEGLLMELYLEHDPKAPEFQSAVSYLMGNLPTVTKPQRDTYYWYYATQVMFHLQDENWEKWQSHLIHALQKSQEMKDPFLKGSWSPYGKAADHWGQVAGRHYVTAMHLLMLEVYYRHLPLFRELHDEETLKHP